MAAEKSGKSKIPSRTEPLAVEKRAARSDSAVWGSFDSLRSLRMTDENVFHFYGWSRGPRTSRDDKNKELNDGPSTSPGQP